MGAVPPAVVRARQASGQGSHRSLFDGGDDFGVGSIDEWLRLVVIGMRVDGGQIALLRPLCLWLVSVTAAMVKEHGRMGMRTGGDGM